MMKLTERHGMRRLYENDEKNFIVEVSDIEHNNKHSYDLMKMWVKKGHMKKFIGFRPMETWPRSAREC